MKLALPEHDLGLEASVTEDDHQSLRLWLRMLSCTNQVQTEIRRRLRTEFGISLARFDYLAQLHRYPEGLSMSALSAYLMVTGGNVTGLTQELEKEGWVVREVDPHDRRSYLLRLTPEGRKSFEQIAAVHESWVVSMFAGMRSAERLTLTDLLGQLRLHAAQAADALAAEPVPASPPKTRRSKR
jgi:DNA-binding MarR family transcriptional regulator